MGVVPDNVKGFVVKADILVNAVLELSGYITLISSNLLTKSVRSVVTTPSVPSNVNSAQDKN